MAKAKRFGAFGGVFTPSILTLLGVIMYLRLPWIVGQAGLLATIGIILVAHIVSGSTGLSVSSIATDKRVETGGTYFIISRSLGLPIGGTLGWALFSGLSLSVSLYLIGFAEVFLGYFGFEVTLNSIRIMGSVVLLLATILTFISTSLTIKTQYIILTIMVLSLLSVFLGRHDYAPTVPQLNSLPESLPWITLFAIFFPAVTGFEAGVSMSGDLKDPRKSIPKGTIAAILVALVVYIGLAFFFSYTVSSDLLVNDTNVLFKIAWIPQLVIAGVLGATLSSALGSILGAPRIMQAVARDRIAPSFLGKGFGPSNEPRNALLFTFLIAQAGILIGELNVIARLVTIFFIITYGFLNITYAVESWASSDFRPSFKIPRIVSIIGALACIILMIQLDILALAVATVILSSLFVYLKNKELTLNTGDTRSSIWLSLVKTGLFNLAKSQRNNRNWRPNIILFSGGAAKRPHLIELALNLVGKLGVFTNFDLSEQSDQEKEPLNGQKRCPNPMLDSTAKIIFEKFDEYTNVITRKHVCSNIYEGIGVISSVYGFSGFEPNTILMGWPKNALENASFEELLSRLKKLSYNLSFLNFNTEKGFGKYKTIDIWWSKSGRNLSLALHLIRFITASSKWRDANIRILTIAESERNTDRLYAHLTQLVDNYRINAEVKVIHNSDNLSDKEIMKSRSANTDLTIADIPSQFDNDSPAVVRFTEEIAKSLNTTLFISASEEFEDIYPEEERESEIAESTEHGSGERCDVSLIGAAARPGVAIVQNKLFLLAQSSQKTAEKFINDTLSQFEPLRKKELDLIVNYIQSAVARRDTASQIANSDIKKQQLKQIYAELANFITLRAETSIRELLQKEEKLLAGGVEEYISKIAEPAEDMLSEAGRAGKKLLPAARYYFRYKRIKALELFYERFKLSTAGYYAQLKELSTLFFNNAPKEKIEELAEHLYAAVHTYGAAEITRLVNELAFDIAELVELSQKPPRTNLVNSRYRSLLRKAAAIDKQLHDYPSKLYKFIYNHVNRFYTDSLLLSLKYKLESRIYEISTDVSIEIDNRLISYLNTLESILSEVKESGKSDKLDKFTLSLTRSLDTPHTESRFNSLLSFIRESTDRLPVTVTVGAETLSEEEFIIYLRKTADFHISNELSDRVNKLSINVAQTLKGATANLRSMVKLASHTLANAEELSIQGSDSPVTEEFLDNLSNNADSERKKLKDTILLIRKEMEEALKLAFEPLTVTAITKSKHSLRKKEKEKERGFIARVVTKAAKSFGGAVSNQFVKLLYKQNEGVLWAARLEKKVSDRQMNSCQSLNAMLEQSAPRKAILSKLPFYYLNLFAGSSGIGEEFWVGMQEETAQGSKAILRSNKGASGMLVISGERRSGKSSLSRHLANLHYRKQQIFVVRAPQESTADTELFQRRLHETIVKERTLTPFLREYRTEESLYAVLDSLQGKLTVIINDLELWWERKPGGTCVVEKILELTKRYNNKILFIVNVNKFASRVINQLTNINTWALDIIYCQPFSAKEIKELITERHKAGGMKFVLNKKSEHQMTNLDYASLFNHLFNLSGGNPGYAIQMWLAAIKKISGTTIYLQKPVAIDGAFTRELSRDEIVYILQFVLHRRFSAPHLAAIMDSDPSATQEMLTLMQQKGLLTEKYTGVYSLTPALVPQLVKKLRNLELL